MISLSVLIVDDSLIMRKKVAAMLEDLGHEVVGTAATGAEAITAFAECKPKLVTMDITMPDMDGIEATKRILESYPAATIVMLTSHGQESMVMEALDAGAKGYVLKPIDKEKFASVLQGVAARYIGCD